MVASVGLTGNDPPGATPLSPEDLEGLVPRHVTTRRQLDEFEEANILQCRVWLLRKKKALDPLDFVDLTSLHRRMFGKTWKWAGTLRMRESNIGIAPDQVANRLRQLLDNTAHELSTTAANVDDVAVRYHHRLVSIHPFPNGNGRHSRLATDLFLKTRGLEPFSWGGAALVDSGPVRERYIDALRAADAGDDRPLHAFVRS